MPTDAAPSPAVPRAQVQARLAEASEEELVAVLLAAGLKPVLGGPPALAEQLVEALWWRSHSPVGHIAMPATLDQLVARVARKLDQELPAGDGWARLDSLTSRLVPGGRVTDLGPLDAETRDRLRKRLWPAWTGVAGGASAAGSRIVALKVLAWTQGPVWDLLPRVPQVGPVFAGIRAGVRTVARASAPLGIALALLSLNQALGPEDDRALPLLLGVGLLARELPSVDEAVEVPASAPAPA